MHRPDLTRDVLADRADINDLLVRYACAVDQRDFAAVASCFAPNVRVTGWAEQTFDNRDDLIDFIRGVGFFDWTMHLFHRIAIHVDGDTAAANSEAMLAHRLERPGKAPMLYNVADAVYVDRLARRAGRWLIVERGGEPTWAESASDDDAKRWLAANAPGDPLLDRALLTETLAAAHPDHLLGNRRFAIGAHEATVLACAIAPEDGTPWWERCRTITDVFHRVSEGGVSAWSSAACG